jgi:Holliday junction resolvasome RuvABC endonuclease subunit
VTASGSKKAEVIIGLDLATKCGWAVLKGRTLVASGRWTLLSSRKGRHRAERWINLESNLSTLVARHAPSVVAYERVRRHVGTSAAHVYGGLLATLEVLDMEWQHDGAAIELLPIEISTWRKAACGRGDAIKEDVVKWAKRRFRYSPATDDEAEALAIAEAVRRIRRGEYTP